MCCIPQEGDLLQVRRHLRRGREGEGVKEAAGSRGSRVQRRRGSQAPGSHSDFLSSPQLRAQERQFSARGSQGLLYTCILSAFILCLTSTRQT